MIGYHITPTTNREAIRREGMRAQDPAWSETPMIGMVKDGVKAVYFATDRASAYTSACTTIGAVDLWEADLEGMATEPDPSVAPRLRCVRVLEDVGPERLRLLVESDSARLAERMLKSMGLAR